MRVVKWCTFSTGPRIRFLHRLSIGFKPAGAVWEKKDAKMKQKCTNRIDFRLEVGGDRTVTQGKECPDQENKLYSKRLEAKKV